MNEIVEIIANQIYQQAKDKVEEQVVAIPDEELRGLSRISLTKLHAVKLTSDCLDRMLDLIPVLIDDMRVTL